MLEKKYLPSPDELLQRELHIILINFFLKNKIDETSIYLSLRILLFLSNGSSDFLDPFYSNDFIINILKLINRNEIFTFNENNNNQIKTKIVILWIFYNLLVDENANKLIKILMDHDIIGISLNCIQKTSSDFEAKVFMKFLNKLIFTVHNTLPEFEIKFIPLVNELIPFLKIQSHLLKYLIEIYCSLINLNENFCRLVITSEIPNLILSGINSFTLSSYLKLINCLYKYCTIKQFETQEFLDLIINLFSFLEIDGLKEFIIFIEGHSLNNFNFSLIIEKMINILNGDNLQKKIIVCTFFIQHFIDIKTFLSPEQMKLIILSFMEISIFLPYDILQKCLNHLIYYCFEFNGLFKEASELTSFYSILQELSNRNDVNINIQNSLRILINQIDT